MLSQQENIERVTAKINSIMANSQHTIYVIIDGDRTFIPTDSTKAFFQYLDLEYTDLKNIFKQHGYTFEAFYKAATFYSKIESEKYNLACLESAGMVSIYPQFLSFINAIKDKAEFILITSGITQSWQNVINNNSLDFMHLIGGNYFPNDNFVVDMQAKGIIANEIRKRNCRVFAFGDTMIDFEMLKEADYSYLVVNERRNKDFIPFAGEIFNLKQVSFLDYFHENIPLTNLDNIKQQILALLP